MGDGFGLSPLFGAKARISADHVNQRDERAVPLLSELHKTQRLAIALGIRLTEVAINALLGVAALLRTEHGDFASVEAGHAANHRRVVGKAAVTVNLADIGKNPLDVIEGIGTHGVAGHFGALPRREFARNLAAQRLYALLQLLKLLEGFLVVGGSALQLLDLFLDALQFRLRAGCGFHSLDGSRELRLVDDAHTAATTEFFNAVDERAVRQHIIAFRFHHDGEVTLTLQVEQHFRLALAVDTNGVQRVDGARRRRLQRNLDAQAAGEFGLRLFQRSNVVDHQLGVGAFFDAHASLYQHGHVELELFR